MTRRLIRVAIIAAALLITALLVSDIEVEWSDEPEGIGVTLLILALVFGLINAFIRPLAKLVSIPLNIATLGLFSVVLNAALLLLVAYLVDLRLRSAHRHRWLPAGPQPGGRRCRGRGLVRHQRRERGPYHPHP